MIKKILIALLVIFSFLPAVLAAELVFEDYHFKLNENPLSRAVAAKMLLTIREGDDFSLERENHFSDLIEGEWYIPYIVKAHELGIIKGYSDGTFKPGNIVKRGEFLKMLSVTFGLKRNLEHQYTDVQGSWVEAYAGIAYRYDLFPGERTRLLFAKEMTREDFSIALFQLIENAQGEIKIEREEMQKIERLKAKNGLLKDKEEESPEEKAEIKREGLTYKSATGSSSSSVQEIASKESSPEGSEDENKNELAEETKDEDQGNTSNDLSTPEIKDEEEREFIGELRTLEIDNFIYQLQATSFAELKADNFSLAVIDWQDAALEKTEVDELKAQGKVMLSYLSIGEAENYRSYWQDDWTSSPPEFLGEENPDWGGNFKVHFWDEEWQKIVFASLDEIIERGYEGAYLDIVDAYYYYQEKGRETAAAEMIDFVKKIANYARTKDPDFIVVPQNALDLLENEDYLSFINGIGKESTWYNGDLNQSEDSVNWVLPLMRSAKEHSKFVLAIEYPIKQHNRCDFISKAESEGFIPLVAPKNLDAKLIVTCEDDNSSSGSTNSNNSNNNSGASTGGSSTATFDADGYDSEGYNAAGYDREGYNKAGYNEAGYDREGYNLTGYDLNGYDRNGFDSEGYDKDGFNAAGYDREWYKRDGYGDEGYDREGYDREGYGREGYDREGYNREGYSREGYNREGYDVNGVQIKVWD
jgi:cysteinyl-tRNA synthetase